MQCAFFLNKSISLQRLTKYQNLIREQAETEKQIQNYEIERNDIVFQIKRGRADNGVELMLQFSQVTRQQLVLKATLKDIEAAKILCWTNIGVTTLASLQDIAKLKIECQEKISIYSQQLEQKSQELDKLYAIGALDEIPLD